MYIRKGGYTSEGNVLFFCMYGDDMYDVLRISVCLNYIIFRHDPIGVAYNVSFPRICVILCVTYMHIQESYMYRCYVTL